MRGLHSKSRLLCGVALGALASALGFGGAGSAQAQPYDWTGFYVGGYVGGAWGHSNASTSTTCPPLGWTGVFTGGYYCSLPSTPATAANAAAVAAAGTGSANSSTFVGGVQAGYNWQSGSVVYGVETDFGSFSLSNSRQGGGVYVANSFLIPPPVMAGKSFTVGTSLSTDWLFTARGRLGWAVSDWLVYVTGGLAVTDMKASLSFSDTVASGGFSGAAGFGSSSSTKLGYTVGAGGQYALNQRWSLKAEYLFVDFGSINTSALVAHPAFVGYSNLLSTSEDLKAHVVRVGVNYKF